MYFLTGGKDGKVKLWKITDLKAPISEWELGESINDLKYNPIEEAFVVATDSYVSYV